MFNEDKSQRRILSKITKEILKIFSNLQNILKTKEIFSSC